MIYSVTVIVSRTIEAEMQDRLAAKNADIIKLKMDKDAVYLERNRVVAALASIFTAGTAQTNIPDWDPEWHGCVYIDLPHGQVSWHYHDSQAHIFAHLPPYTKPWDGHTTEEKYRRLADLNLSSAAKDILAERVRHIHVEGWHAEHDDLHDDGQMAAAAACYAVNSTIAHEQRGTGSKWNLMMKVTVWPWDLKWWKPTSPRRNLVKAGALILAEIDRLDREEKKSC